MQLEFVKERGISTLSHPRPLRNAYAALGNIVEFFRYWGSSKHVRRRESPEISWVESALEFSLFNRVYASNLRPETADASIEEVISNFENRALTLDWPVLPGMKPDDLPARLRKHGFILKDNSPAMTIDLRRFSPDPPRLNELQIRKVESDEDLRVFMDVAARAYEVSNRDHGIFLEILRSLEVGSRSRYKCYLGTLNGQPVATSLLFIAGGAAGIYWIGTVPESRGLGVGTQMTIRPLIDARIAGFDIATLQATEMGDPVYRRIGFKECFRFDVYVRRHIPG